MRALFQSERGLYWLLAALSAMVAGWVILQTHGVINNDGVLYVESAKLYRLGQWREGIALYPWPLYPLLIALLHKISGLGLQVSAHMLAILFFALASIGLAKLVQELGGNRPTAVTASLLLLASPYLAGDILPMVVRDHGAWALHLWSLVYLLRFLRTSSWNHALAWGASATGAMLFRVEAMTFLVLLPFIVLARPTLSWQARMALLLRSQTLLMLSALLVATTLFLTGFKLRDLGRLDEPLKVLSRVQLQFSQGLESKAQLMADQVLGSYLNDYALAGLLLTLAYILVVKAVGCAGWLQFGLALLNGKKGMPVSEDGKRLLGWLMLLALVNGAMILLNGFLLPSRMLAPFAFVVIVAAAFGLERLRQQWLNRAAGSSLASLAWPAAGLLLALQLLAVLRPGTPQDAYEIEAVHWTIAHTPSGSRVLYDSTRLAYYAGQPLLTKTRKADAAAQRILDSEAILAYDYAVVHAKRDSPTGKYTERFGSPLATFSNRRGDLVLVYRIPSG